MKSGRATSRSLRHAPTPPPSAPRACGADQLLAAGAIGDAQALAALGEALDQLGAGSARRLAEIAGLSRVFPRRAIWPPMGSDLWTAVRPAGLMPPDP